MIGHARKERCCVSNLGSSPGIMVHSWRSLASTCWKYNQVFVFHQKSPYTGISQNFASKVGMWASLKWYVPIAFLSPRAQLEVVLFWYQMKAHIFLIITQKFHLQIHYTVAAIAENVLISGIPILIFLCIFITASSPVSLSYFCPRSENNKQPWGKIVENVLRVKVN